MAEAARQAASGAGVVWSGIKSVAVPASSAVIPALTAVAGVGSAVFDFIKFEIIRDFLQIIGLFFEGLRESLPSSFKTFWGNVAAFFRICFTCWLTDFYARNKLTISIVIFIIKAVIALIASIWFYGRVRNQSSNADKEGLDVVTWEMRSTKSKNITKYLVLVLTTLYLPVATDVVQILTCDLQFVAPGGDCYKHGHLGLTIAAVFIILIYMIPIPFQFVSLIHKNKPKVTLYDSLGQLRAGTTAYSDADYRADLEKDNSPFKSLYEDYERKWAYYKVIVMLMKLALILPVTLLVPTNGIGGRDPNAIVVDNTKKILIIQSAITLVVLGIYAIAAWTTAPFLEDSNDVLDGISRAACLGTGLLGLLTVVINNNKAETIFGIILNVINAIAMILMVILVLAAFPAVRRAARNVRQTLSFSMSRANRNQSLLFSAEFSLARERKLRIWHEFWDVIFSQDEQLRIPKDEKASQDDKDPNKYVPIQLGYSIGKMTPPYLVQFRGTVGERHAENKHIVAHESWASVEHALLLLGRMSPSDATQLTADMQTVLQSLVGLDVWCNLPFEGHPEGEEGTQRKRLTIMNTSSTKFGKLYVVPFPFCAVFISDDTDGQCIISYCPIVHGITRDANQGLKEFQEFVRSNFDPEVQRRRNIRLSLRALSGNRIYFYYQCTKNKTKSRQVSKTRTVRDANGHSRTEHYTETEHYTVSVLFTFHYGLFSVSHDGDVPWVNPATNEVLNVAKGFSVSLHFNDGEGYDHEGKHWTNESETIYAGTLGITSDYAMTDGLRKVLGYEGGPYAGNAVWQNHLPTIQSRYHAYRQHYVNEFKRKEQVLSYAFWYYVYTNDHITQQQLYQVLTQNETNPLIRALPEKYHDEFKMLYTKLQYFDAHPSAGFWFCFWHDVWIYNKDLKIIKDNAALFDVYQSDAIAYKPMIPSDLIELLQQHKLTGKAPGRFSLRQHWFNDALLDQLYNKMDQLAATVASAPPVEPSVQAQLVDNYSKASDFYQTPQLVRQHTAPEQVQEEKQLPPPESSIQPIAPTEPTTPAGNVVIEVTSSQGAPLLQQTIDSSSGTPTSTYTNIVQPITPTTTTPRGTSIMNPTNGPAPAPVNAWSGTMTTTPTMQPVMQPMTPGQPPQQQPYQGQPQQYYSPYPQGQPYPQQQPYPQAQPYPQQQPYPGQPQQYYVPHPGSPVHVPSQGYPQASPTQQYAPPPQSNSPPPGYFAPHPNAQYQPLQ